MWLVSDDGFFAIENRPRVPQGHLLVRARDEQSLVDMKKRLINAAEAEIPGVGNKINDPIEGSGIETTEGKRWFGKRIHHSGLDQEWRMPVPRSLIRVYLDLVLDDLNYENLKVASSKRWRHHLGRDISDGRLDALHQAWTAIARFWPRSKDIPDIEGNQNTVPDN